MDIENRNILCYFESVEKVTNSLDRAYVSEPGNTYVATTVYYSSNTDQPCRSILYLFCMKKYLLY